MKENIIAGIAIVALILSGWAVTHPISGVSDSSGRLGAATTAGSLLAENYIPYVLYNGGYSSAKDIATTANLNGAIVTATGGLVNSATGATSTIFVTSNTANVGGCIQLNGTSSATVLKVMATSTNVPLFAQFGTCQ